jgi:hypothetical protein
LNTRFADLPTGPIDQRTLAAIGRHVQDDPGRATLHLFVAPKRAAIKGVTAVIAVSEQQHIPSCRAASGEIEAYRVGIGLSPR